MFAPAAPNHLHRVPAQYPDQLHLYAFSGSPARGEPRPGEPVLRTRNLPVNQLRELVLPLLHDSPEAFLLVDDSRQDKKYSRFIEVAKGQYSGNAHGIVTGIGLVNLVHSSGEAGDLLPLDYGVYAPEEDGQTKNDHFLAMFDQVVAGDKLLARIILFDT